MYRWRIKLPADLVQSTGRREVSRSLRTDSYRLAKRRLVLAEADWARTTAAIRDGVQGGMTSEEIDALVRDFVRSELDERAALVKVAGTDEALAERLKQNDAERERFRRIIVKEVSSHGGSGSWRFTRGWVYPFLESGGALPVPQATN